jgi:hypothetical protein
MDDNKTIKMPWTPEEFLAMRARDTAGAETDPTPIAAGHAWVDGYLVDVARLTAENELLREDKLKRDDLVEQVRSMQVEMEGWKEEAGDAEELRADLVNWKEGFKREEGAATAYREQNAVLRATIARVEALPDKWRHQRNVDALDESAAVRGMDTADLRCAEELEAELRGDNV